MPAINDLEGLDQRIVAYVRQLGPKSDGGVRVTGHGLARDLGVDVQQVRDALGRLEGDYLNAERRMEPTSEHWDVYSTKGDVT